VPQEIAQNAVLMARETQSFSFQKHIENEASSFRPHPFMNILAGHCNWISKPFAGSRVWPDRIGTPRNVSMQDAFI